MSRRSSLLWTRNKEANQPLPTPKTPLDQKASGKKTLSIDEFISNPSPQWTTKEHRWSFSSNVSNPNSVYLDLETKDGTPKKPKRGRRPKPLLTKSDLESIEASSSSEESEMSESEPRVMSEPITYEEKFQKIKIARKKKQGRSLDVGKLDSNTHIEAPSGKDSKSSPSNGDFKFGWSRISSAKLTQKKEEWKEKMSSNPSDFISQSVRNTPLTSSGEKKPLKKTRSLETFTRKPMKRSQSERNVGGESSANNKQPVLFSRQLPWSKSTRNLDRSSRDKSLEPSDLTEETKAKATSSRKLDESNRSRNEVRSLDRLTMKKTKSSRRMTREDSSGKEEQPAEETKEKLGSSLSDLSLDSSSGQRRRKTKPKSSRRMTREDSAGSEEQPTEETKTMSKSSPTLDGANRNRKQVRSLDRLTKKQSSRRMTREDSSGSEEQPTEEAKTKSSLKLDQSNRNRKDVRSLDRLTMKKTKSSRRMTREDSSGKEEQPAEETKEKLDSSLPDLSLDSSFGQLRRKTKPKSTASVDVNHVDTDLSLDSFPGKKKTRKSRSKSLDLWGGYDENDFTQALSSSHEKFYKARPRESDATENVDAMQMWSARMKSTDNSEESPERRKILERTRSARFDKLMKEDSLHDLSLDDPVDQRKKSPERRKTMERTRSARFDNLMRGNSLRDLSLDAPFDQRKKTNKPKSRSSINVCSNQNEHYGGRVRRTQKQRSRSLDHDTTWIHCSESDLSVGLEKTGSTRNLNECVDEKTNNRDRIIPNDPFGRPSFRLGATRRVPSARNLNQPSDHSQTSGSQKKLSKTRSDGSLSKARRKESAVEGTALNRTTSVRTLNSSSSSIRIDCTGQLISSGTRSQSLRIIHDPVEDDLSVTDRNDKDDVYENSLVMSQQGPAASEKKISEVIDDMSEALHETDRLKRIMEVESVLHKLQDAFQRFDLKLDDDDAMKSTMLEGENKVLRIRLQQQDELLKKYKNQFAEQSTSVQSTPAVEKDRDDKTADQMKQELEEMKAKLEEKEKTIQEQASRCSKMEEKMEELQEHAQSGKEVSSLNKRIWELEKEKTAFMTEISRLHKSNFDASVRTVSSPESMTSFSLSERSDPHGAGFVGWLMGGQTHQ